MRPVDTRQIVGCWRSERRRNPSALQSRSQMSDRPPDMPVLPDDAARNARKRAAAYRQMPIAFTYTQCANTVELLVFVSVMRVSRASIRDHLRPDDHRSRTIRGGVRSGLRPHSTMAASTTPRLNSHGFRFCTSHCTPLSVTAPLANRGPSALPLNAVWLIAICCPAVKRKRDEMPRVAHLLLAHSPPTGGSPFRLPLSRNPLHGRSDRRTRVYAMQTRAQENRFLLFAASSPWAGIGGADPGVQG